MAAKVQIIFYLQSVKYLFFVKNKLFFSRKNDYLYRKIDQSTYFLGKMRIHVAAFQDTEIIVSKDKVASVKRWLDS